MINQYRHLTVDGNVKKRKLLREPRLRRRRWKQLRLIINVKNARTKEADKQQVLNKLQNVKSFASHKACRAALISVSLALS